MIKSVTITNYLQESVKIVLTEPESSGFIIRSIEGLGPAKANVNFTELATLDGALDNGAMLESKNIVLSLIFIGTPTIEDTRLKSYKYFPIKQNVKFEIETDNRHCFITGRVESNVPKIFAESGTDREGCQISIMCPGSYFQDVEDTIVDLYSTTSEFEFPFENDSLSHEGKNLLQLDIFTRWFANGLEFNTKINNIVDVIGRATKTTNITIAETEYDLNPGSKYELFGCPFKGSSGTYKLSVYTKSGTFVGDDYGTGFIFTAIESKYVVKIVVQKGCDLKQRFEPVIKILDSEDIPIGNNLLDISDTEISINDLILTIQDNSIINITGDHTDTDDDIELDIATLSNIPDEQEYILNGSPDDEEKCKLSLVSMINEEQDADTGSGVTFTKTSDTDYYRLRLVLLHPESTYTYNNVLIKPMIRNSIITDPTFEAYIPIEDAGPLIEFGSIEFKYDTNIEYSGDCEVGINIEIYVTGSASGIIIYQPDINTQIKISDSIFSSILGSGIQAGDTILINTEKGNKKIRALRNGVYYNILNAVEAPRSWLYLRKGDNRIVLDATNGLSNLRHKITYRPLYEGV